MNVGIAANTSTFYHLPDTLSHKPHDLLFPTHHDIFYSARKSPKGGC
jgi:hypothetical protein